jgi:hypothetical protein
MTKISITIEVPNIGRSPVTVVNALKALIRALEAEARIPDDMYIPIESLAEKVIGGIHLSSKFDQVNLIRRGHERKC